MNEQEYFEQFAGDGTGDDRRAILRDYAYGRGYAISEEGITRVLQKLDAMKLEAAKRIQIISDFEPMPYDEIWPVRFGVRWPRFDMDKFTWPTIE